MIDITLLRSIAEIVYSQSKKKDNSFNQLMAYLYVLT